MKKNTSGKSMKRDTRFGVFSFFTGAGFHDLSFEDAGFAPCKCIAVGAEAHGLV